MCCCCCCCFYSKVPGNGGSRNWLCFFLTTMFFSLLGIIVGAAIQIFIGGPFPTAAFDTGSGIFFAANVIVFLFAILCIVVIVRVIRNPIIGIIGLVGMVLYCILMLACVIYLAQEPNEDSISSYTKKYFKDKKGVPPSLDYLQKFLRDLGSKEKGNDFACCGGMDFEDYVESKRWVYSTIDFGHYVFDAPDSCCKSNFMDKDCGKNLTYFLHKIDDAVNDESLKAIKMGKKLEDKIEEITDELEKNTPIQKTRVEKGPTDNYTMKEMEEKAKSDLTNYTAYRDRRKSEVKIHTLGCGRLYDEIRSGKINDALGGQSMFTLALPGLFGSIIAYTVLELLLGVASILIYVWYFYRYNYSAVPVSPQEGGDAGGALEGDTALSEGVGNPRMDTHPSRKTVATEGGVKTPVGTPPPSPSPPENP